MKKKFKFSIKDFLNKKENLAIMAVAFVFCAGLIVTNMKSGDIPLHDGDVLVDSQNVQTAGETGGEGDAAQKEDASAEEQGGGEHMQKLPAAYLTASGGRCRYGTGRRKSGGDQSETE